MGIFKLYMYNVVKKRCNNYCVVKRPSVDIFSSIRKLISAIWKTKVLIKTFGVHSKYCSVTDTSKGIGVILCSGVS